MIKLIELLKEESSEQKPYMYSPVGFSCAVCEYMNYNKEEDRYTCSNPDYQSYMGTYYLVDDNRQPIQDPTKWCSNWFEPKTK